MERESFLEGLPTMWWTAVMRSRCGMVGVLRTEDFQDTSEDRGTEMASESDSGDAAGSVMTSASWEKWKRRLTHVLRFLTNISASPRSSGQANSGGAMGPGTMEISSIFSAGMGKMRVDS